MSVPDSRGATSRPATSLDVARKAGVSRTTVSYILNHVQGVSFSEETRKAVFDAAEELHYRPNLMARSLVSGSGPIILVLPRLPQNEITTTTFARAAAELFSHGFITTIVQMGDDVTATVESIISLQPSAVVFLTDTWGEVEEKVSAASITVIRPELPHEEFDSRIIGTLQVGHLADRGHTRLAFATATEANELGAPPRQTDVEHACAEIGLAPPVVSAIKRDGDGAADVIRSWHAAGVTAVCAFNDEVALAVLYGIREAGLTCPGDLAVIGCDNIPASSVAYPPLSTIAFDDVQTTKLVVWLILTKLGRAADTPEAAHAMLHVVERESTR